MTEAEDEGEALVTIEVRVPMGALGRILTEEDIAVAAQDYVNETVAGQE